MRCVAQHNQIIVHKFVSKLSHNKYIAHTSNAIRPGVLRRQLLLRIRRLNGWQLWHQPDRMCTGDDMASQRTMWRKSDECRLRPQIVGVARTPDRVFCQHTKTFRVCRVVQRMRPHLLMHSDSARCVPFSRNKTHDDDDDVEHFVLLEQYVEYVCIFIEMHEPSKSYCLL